MLLVVFVGIPNVYAYIKWNAEFTEFMEMPRETITGSLVNAKAIVEYIKSRNIDDISLVTLARPGEDPFEEDELCAKYIESLLENEFIDMKKEIEKLKESRGLRFFDKLTQQDFPERDFYLCTELNKFNFILKANRDTDGMINIEKVEV